LKRGANPGANDPIGYNMLKNNMEIFEMKVPGNKCGLIIGKGGETIKSLSEQYGVKLVVVQETSAPSNGEKPLRITGEPSKVAKAKEAVMALLNPQDNYKGSGGDRNGGGRGGGYGTNDYGSKSGGDRRGGDRNDRNGGASEVFIKVPGDKAGIVIGKGK
jgi:far upstream element-binding protein